VGTKLLYYSLYIYFFNFALETPVQLTPIAGFEPFWNFLFIIPGGSPYPGMNGHQVRDFISQGKRIPKPMHLDNEL
jgi:hypothetical protein